MKENSEPETEFDFRALRTRHCGGGWKPPETFWVLSIPVGKGMLPRRSGYGQLSALTVLGKL